jgi:outer membrane autotransporter protein
VTEEVAGALALSAAFAPINRDLFGDLGARIGTGDALRRPGMADGGTSHDGGAGEGGSEVDFDTTHFFVQLGLDAFWAEAAGGSFVGSVMAQYGNADGDVDRNGIGPSTDFDVTSYGVGIGATWYAGDGDTYVDLTGMLNWHDIDVAVLGG